MHFVFEAHAEEFGWAAIWGGEVPDPGILFAIIVTDFKTKNWAARRVTSAIKTLLLGTSLADESFTFEILYV